MDNLKKCTKKLGVHSWYPNCNLGTPYMYLLPLMPHFLPLTPLLIIFYPLHLALNLLAYISYPLPLPYPSPFPLPITCDPLPFIPYPPLPCILHSFLLLLIPHPSPFSPDLHPVPLHPLPLLRTLNPLP